MSKKSWLILVLAVASMGMAGFFVCRGIFEERMTLGVAEFQAGLVREPGMEFPESGRWVIQIEDLNVNTMTELWGAYEARTERGIELRIVKRNLSLPSFGMRRPDILMEDDESGNSFLTIENAAGLPVIFVDSKGATKVFDHGSGVARTPP